MENKLKEGDQVEERENILTESKVERRDEKYIK